MLAHIVVCGGGYAGIQAALELDRLGKDHKVTLIDRNENHILLPSLPEAIMKRGFYQIPYRLIFDKRRVSFIQSDIRMINLDKKQVVTSGSTIGYDVLVIALGGVPNLPDIPGLESVYKFNDIDDLQKVILRLSRAQDETIVVAGGGATGVEVVSEIAAYAETSGRKLKIILASPSLLASFPENAKSWARSYLRALGVELRIGKQKAVSKVYGGSVVLCNGESIKSNFVIWAGGTKGSSFAKQIGLTTGDKDRAVVNQFLQSVDCPEVFVVGDCALVLDKQGQQLATSAQFAEQQGKLAANNAIAFFNGEDMKQYCPSSGGFAISIGPSFAVARVGTLDLYGSIASSAKKLIKLRYLKEIAGASAAAKEYLSLPP